MDKSNVFYEAKQGSDPKNGYKHNGFRVDNNYTGPNWRRVVDLELNGEITSEESAGSTTKAKQITFSYQKKNNEAAISIDGVSLLYKSELASIIAAPGVGKTNWIENITATLLAKIHGIPYEDNLGVTAPAANSKSRVLLCDLERPMDDIDTSHRRIFKRLKSPFHIISNDIIPGLDYLSLIEFEKLDEKKSEIESWLDINEYDYLILDGGLDLVDDMNDPKGSAASVRWLRAVAAKYNIAIIITLHPNKNSETAAGHFGTYLQRWSRAFLLIKTAGVDGSRVITTDFDLGKLSHTHLKIEHYFRWNAEKGYFTSCNQSDSYLHKKSNSLEKTIKEIFISQQTTQLPATKMKKTMMEKLNCSETTVKRKLAEAADFGYISIIGTGKGATYNIESI
jgi:hypothetical protein